MMLYDSFLKDHLKNIYDIQAMKKSKFDHQSNPSESRKTSRKGWQTRDEDEGHPGHKTKKSGKRFHRRKTHKDDFWDSLTNED